MNILTGNVTGRLKICRMAYSTTQATQAWKKNAEEWILTLNRGNYFVLNQYLQLEDVSLDIPQFVMSDVPIASFWNFLNSFEDPQLRRKMLPIQGLSIFLAAHRRHSSVESWESYIRATSAFIKRIVKRKFQKKKENVGRGASNSILSASSAVQLR